MGVLRFEFQRGGEWQSAVMMTPQDQPGSITHYGADGRRQVIVFQCCGGWSTVSRSRGGVDEETARTRVVYALGYDLLAKMLTGQRHEMTVRLADGTSYQARWSHEDSE